MTVTPLPIDVELMNELFFLDEKTGSLIRRVTRAPNAKAGDVVGTVDGKGYLHVSVDRKFIRLHRIVFLMHYGWEPHQIDHINTDKQDNRPENLRPTTSRQNSGNINPPKHNTSGVKGVSKNGKTGFWHAQIKIDGKQTYLGRSYDIAEAKKLYEDGAKKHFGDYARLASVG